MLRASLHRRSVSGRFSAALICSPADLRLFFRLIYLIGLALRTGCRLLPLTLGCFTANLLVRSFFFSFFLRHALRF